ncbi:MAG: hypothetical protein AAFZ92_05725 [Pseudomonadota bacterium]
MQNLGALAKDKLDLGIISVNVHNADKGTILGLADAGMTDVHRRYRIG